MPLSLIFVGIDWSEGHHDLCVEDESGKVLARRRIGNDPEGLTQLQATLAGRVEEPEQVVVGIEANQGPMLQALRASGYTIYALNPLAASRYRERHSASRAKSDRGDAKLLAEIVRTDRHNHRRLPEDSQQAEAIQVLARAHKNAIWTRQQLANQLRSALVEFYPGALAAFGEDLDAAETLAILKLAWTPVLGRQLLLAKIHSTLRRAGRQRYLETRTQTIQAALRAPQLEQPAKIAQAYGQSVLALVQVLQALNLQVAALEAELAASFKVHPDAEIYLSQPGLGNVLGARALGEFGDDPNRFINGKARRNYASTSPITKASGNKKVVLARFVHNDRLADVCHQWAFAALTGSTGARRYYDVKRERQKDHEQALRAVGNRLVGILDGCLRHRQLYSEAIAWPNTIEQETAA
jgi:transposase